MLEAILKWFRNLFAPPREPPASEPPPTDPTEPPPAVVTPPAFVSWGQTDITFDALRSLTFRELE